MYFTDAGKLFPPGLINFQIVTQHGEFMPVFGIINGNGRSSQNIYLLLIKPHGQVIGYLSSHRKNNPMWIFQFNDIHYPFKGEFIKIQPVADIIIRTYGFGIVIDHNRPITFLVDGIQVHSHCTSQIQHCCRCGRLLIQEQ